MSGGRHSLVAAASIAACLAAAAAAPAAARVVLVGVDGASWNVIDPMLARGELPHWAALARRGVSARLEEVEPLNSPAVWTSLATGRSPSAHGVTDFQATRLTLRAPTVFERLARAGHRVGLYDYLVTWPPPALPGGFAVPGWLRHDDRVTPPDLWQRIGAEPFVHRIGDEHTPEAFLALVRREAERKAPRFRRMLETFDPEVATVSFYGVDVASHRFWHAAFPEAFDGPLPPAPPAQRTAIADALRGVDRSLGEIETSLGPDDVLLVASDHGFRAADGIMPIWVPQLARAIEDAGLDPARDGFHVITTFGVVVVAVHAGPFEEREAVLERLLDLLHGCRSENGDPLYRVDWIDVAPRPPGEERPLLERLRQWALRWTAEHVHHLNTSRPGHAYVFARPDGDALARLWPRGRVVVADRPQSVSQAFRRDAFSGDHAEPGVFLAAGAPIAARAQRVRLSVLDVAPLLLYLAGSPIPDDLEGRLPEELIESGWRATHPPVHVPAEVLPGPPPGAASLPADLDADLTEKLRALGYLR